ncbi:MAG TPA: hypothetical protein VMD76_13985 [Candidatus Sulfotelmatobacter sp.]|nr:hypothetical protein [Candidatus Sulfotelmatobacter sp.]
MSILGIAGSLLSYQNPTVQTSLQTNLQKFQQDFQQLGQDLQSGNTTAAQSDLTTLQQLTGTAISSSSPLSQSLSQLSQDLQSGNISGAKQDYSSALQDVQNHAAHSHLRRRIDGLNDGSSGSASAQSMQALSQELQSGTTTSAAQSYAGVQLNLSPFDPASTPSSGSSGISISA